MSSPSLTFDLVLVSLRALSPSYKLTGWRESCERAVTALNSNTQLQLHETAAAACVTGVPPQLCSSFLAAAAAVLQVY